MVLDMSTSMQPFAPYIAAVQLAYTFGIAYLHAV